MYAKYRILPFNVKVPVDNKKQQAIAKILSTADQEIDLLEQELSEQKKRKISDAIALNFGRVN